MKNVTGQVHTKPQKTSQKRGCMSRVSQTGVEGPFQTAGPGGSTRTGTEEQGTPTHSVHEGRSGGRPKQWSVTLVMKDTYTKARGPQTA